MTSEVKLEPTAEEIERVVAVIAHADRNDTWGEIARAAILAMDRRAEVVGDDVEDLIERLLDAQQDINLAANEHMSQPLCDASALIDEVERVLRKLASPPAPAVAEYRCPKCGAAADERWDCCEVHALTAPAVAVKPHGYKYAPIEPDADIERRLSIAIAQGKSTYAIWRAVMASPSIKETL